MFTRALQSSNWDVLRNRDFRLLWFGALASGTGSNMQVIAVNWQVLLLLRGQSYHLAFAGVRLTLRADALGLGALGLARVGPLIALALFGGMLADAMDRRRLIALAQIAAMLNAGVLALATLTGHASVALLYAMTASGVAIEAFDTPAQTALLPELVDTGQLTGAYTLAGLIWPLETLVGPAVAGLLIARFAVGTVYALNAASFVAVLLAVLAIRHREHRHIERPAVDWRGFVDGVRFARRTSLIWATLMIDLYATFFGSARAMVPLVAADVLHTGPQGYGLLATAQPVGGSLAGLIMSARKSGPRQGQILLVSVAGFGIAWALFGVSRIYLLSYALYAATGATDIVSTVIRTVMRQRLTPNEMRGRVAGLHLMLGNAGPQLGEVESGLLAALAGVPFAVVAGGLVTVALTVGAAYVWPELRHPLPPSAMTSVGSAASQ